MCVHGDPHFPPVLTGAWQGEGDVLHILWSLCKCWVLSPGHRPPSSAAGTKHLLIDPLFLPHFLSSFAPVTDGGSLAASRAGSSLQVNTAPRLHSPRGARTGLQSNVVTRQSRERAGDKSGGSRKRPVLVSKIVYWDKDSQSESTCRVKPLGISNAVHTTCRFAEARCC